MHSTSIQAPCVHQDPEFIRVIEDCYACLAFDAMGGRFELLIAKGSGVSRYETQAVAEELRELVLDWHHRLSLFEPSSTTSTINRAAAGTAIVLDDDMFSLCALCDHHRIRTRGAFNIASGTLMHVHGFRNNSSTHADSLEGLALEHAIVLDHQRQSITRTDDRVSIDFGAIAKGFVLDRIRAELDEHGIENAFIHGGTSSILALGRDHQTLPWAAGINDQYKLSLSGYAVGISERFSQTQTRGSECVGHVMDPTTNRPASNTIEQVVCVHTSAAAADVYSTACCVNPSLIDVLCTDPCTLIALDSSREQIIHDPLRVVQYQGLNYDRA